MSLSPKNIREKVDFLLTEAGFEPTELVDLLVDQRYLLSLSVSQNLRPKVNFFKAAGLIEKDKLLSDVLKSRWYLFTSLPSKIIPRYRYLRHFGLEDQLNLHVVCIASTREFDALAAASQPRGVSLDEFLVKYPMQEAERREFERLCRAQIF